MKFEGTQVNIPIKGIMRAGTDNLCADGAMNEVVGMEYKDGSWLPYKEGEQEWQVTLTFPVGNVTTIERVFVHKLSDDESKLLFLLSDGRLLYEAQRYTEGEHTIRTSLLASNVKDVSFIGNAVCVATDSWMQTFIWKTNGYSQIGTTDISLPYISLRTTSGFKRKNSSVLTTGLYKCEQYVQSDNFETTTGYDHSIPTNGQINGAMNDLMQSLVVGVLGEARDKGALTGYCLGCVAFRMTNGEFIAASAPVLLSRPMSAHGSGEDGYREVFYYGDEGTLTENLSYTDTQGAHTTKVYSYHRDSEPEGTYDDYLVFLAKYSGESYELDTRTGSHEIYETTTNKKSQIAASVSTYLHLYWQMRNSATSSLGGTVYTPTVHLAIAAQDEPSDDKRNWYFSAFAAYAGLQYKIQDSIDINVLKQYGVESICVFITPEVSPYYVSDNAKFHNTFSTSGGFLPFMRHQESGGGFYRGRSQQIRRRKATEIIDELKELSGFYLVDEVFLEDIDTTQTPDWTNIDLEGKLGDTLVTLEQLPLSALNRTKTFPEHLDAYNYRLHAYDYMQELFKGFDLRQYNYYSGFGQIADKNFSLQSELIGQEKIKWEIQVEMENEDGHAAVVNYDNVGVNPCVASLSSFLSYPNVKANNITIIAYRIPVDVQRAAVWKTVLPLTALRNMGMAAYISPDLSPVDLTDGTSADFPSSIPTLDTDNNIKDYHNGLKVSDVAYPTYFPMEYTYRIGNEKIIGLARLSMPMSQDNFGNYSLIVFCTDGIYSLRVDTSGNGVYTSQAFVSPEVCVNQNSICEIGGAVLFAGDKGLMILTGENNVELYAPQLNGVPRFLPANSHSKEAHGVYRKMIDSTQILSQSTEGDFYDSISQDDFKDFITDQETHLIYISNKNKLLAYNGKKVNGVRAYDFSYFIDIPTRNTTKLAMTALCDDGDIIGRTIWENNTNTYTVHTFGYLSETDKSIPCLIQSRPIKVQQDDKCSYRVVLTGYFNGDQGHWADLVVLGSLDADHWRVIGVKEKKLEGGFHNLGCLTERGSWKYLMFIFAGQLNNNSHIDSVDITVDGRYNNKKR